MLEKCAFCQLSLTSTHCPGCKRAVCSQCSVTTFIEGKPLRLCRECNEKNEAFERGEWLDDIGEERPRKKKKKKCKITKISDLEVL